MNRANGSILYYSKTFSSYVYQWTSIEIYIFCAVLFCRNHIYDLHLDVWWQWHLVYKRPFCQPSSQRYSVAGEALSMMVPQATPESKSICLTSSFTKLSAFTCSLQNDQPQGFYLYWAVTPVWSTNVRLRRPCIISPLLCLLAHSPPPRSIWSLGVWACLWGLTVLPATTCRKCVLSCADSA